MRLRTKVILWLLAVSALMAIALSVEYATYTPHSASVAAS